MGYMHRYNKAMICKKTLTQLLTNEYELCDDAINLSSQLNIKQFRKILES